MSGSNISEHFNHHRLKMFCASRNLTWGFLNIRIFHCEPETDVDRNKIILAADNLPWYWIPATRPILCILNNGCSIPICNRHEAPPSLLDNEMGSKLNLPDSSTENWDFLQKKARNNHQYWLFVALISTAGEIKIIEYPRVGISQCGWPSADALKYHEQMARA